MSASAPVEVLPGPDGSDFQCENMSCPSQLFDFEPGDLPLMRCSSCKDKFYCSVKCQSRDWKRYHKFSCSPLDGPSVGILSGSALDDEVSRMGKVIGDLKDAFDAVDGRSNWYRIHGPSLPGARALRDLTQSSLLPQYNREPMGASKYPYRFPLILIGRIFLVSYVSGLPIECKPMWEESMSDTRRVGIEVIHPTRLSGPKITSRPADLSAGEYEEVLHLASGFGRPRLAFREEEGPDLSSEEEQIRWRGLFVAMSLFWDAGV